MKENITSILAIITAIISFIGAIIVFVNSIKKTGKSNDSFVSPNINFNNKQKIETTNSTISNQVAQGNNVTANQYTYDNSKTINYYDNRKNQVTHTNNSNEGALSDPITFFIWLLIVFALCIYISIKINTHLWVIELPVLVTTAILILKLLFKNKNICLEKAEIIRNILVIISPAFIFGLNYFLSNIYEVSTITPEIMNLHNIGEILNYIGNHSKNIYEIALFCMNNLFTVCASVLLLLTQLALVFRNIEKGKIGYFINIINKAWFVYIIISLLPLLFYLIFIIQKAINNI